MVQWEQSTVPERTCIIAMITIRLRYLETDGLMGSLKHAEHKQALGVRYIKISTWEEKGAKTLRELMNPKTNGRNEDQWS